MNIKEAAKVAIEQVKEQAYPWVDQAQLMAMAEQIEQLSAESLIDRSTKLHFTASAFVCQHGRAFFIEHPYLHRLLLPAGHVEVGETFEEAARREFHEETGYRLNPSISGQLIDINQHSIPANPAKSEGVHHHIDFRFLFSWNGETSKDSAELVVHRLTVEQAPEEFRPYYRFDQYDAK